MPKAYKSFCQTLFAILIDHADTIKIAYSLSYSENTLISI